MLCCGHGRHRLPEPTGDTSHPLSEARSQLSVTGTPLGISVSGHSGSGGGDGGGDPRPGASCVLTDVFCLLPGGLAAPVEQRQEHTVPCWSGFFLLSAADGAGQKEVFASFVLFCF